MRERAIGLKQKTREELIAGQRAEQPGWSDAELEPWADAKQRFSPNVLSVYDQNNGSNVDWPVVLRRITCPALLITADPERGAIVTEESAATLKSLVPHLQIAHVPGAGHNIRRDQFDTVHGRHARIPHRSTRAGKDRVVDTAAWCPRQICAAPVSTGGQNRPDGSAKAPSTELTMLLRWPGSEGHFFIGRHRPVRRPRQ